MSPRLIFFGTVRLFLKIFQCPQWVTIWLFCYFARKCMFGNQSKRVFFSIFRHFATVSEKKIFKCATFPKGSSFFPKMFCAFWALDIAPTSDVPVLFSKHRTSLQRMFLFVLYTGCCDWWSDFNVALALAWLEGRHALKTLDIVWVLVVFIRSICIYYTK